MEEKSSLYLVAVVAIVAIVAIIVLVMGVGRTTNQTTSEEAVVVDNGDTPIDTTGAAYSRYTGTWVEYCMEECAPKGVCGAVTYKGAPVSCKCCSGADRLPGT